MASRQASPCCGERTHQSISGAYAEHTHTHNYRQHLSISRHCCAWCTIINSGQQQRQHTAAAGWLHSRRSRRRSISQCVFAIVRFRANLFYLLCWLGTGSRSRQTIASVDSERDSENEQTQARRGRKIENPKKIANKSYKSRKQNRKIKQTKRNNSISTKQRANKQIQIPPFTQSPSTSRNQTKWNKKKTKRKTKEN